MDGQIGRILRKRDCGGIIFLTVRSSETVIQVAGTSETSEFADLKRLPCGSIIRMWGSWGETNRGAKTLFLTRFKCLIRPNEHLPDKFHGMSEEQRHRRRTLDLLTNEDAFEAALVNAQILRSLREELDERGYREFNTGILQQVFEGGLAKPFETRLEATRTPHYLSLTSELKLKRLVAAGFVRVAEITQSFRNEGLGRYHSPEFTLLEAYGVDETLQGMIDLATGILMRNAHFAQEALQAPAFLRFDQAYASFVDASASMSLERLIELHPDKFVSGMPYFTWVMKALEVLIGPHLVQPTFVTDLPAGLSPLVKRKADDPSVTERAFLFGRGLFIADLYVDENDPEILERELRAQASLKGATVNEEYLQVVRMGIPPTAGIGLGVNRLQMFYLSEKLPFHIRETILFPLG